MNYDFFDTILRKHNLHEEPAFDDVLVQIAPLPSEYRQTLGLYYPDADPLTRVAPGTIWVPPDANEETVLHELGHRFGHYHNDNLSEGFAEQFRIERHFQPISRKPSMLVTEDHTTRNILIAVGVIAVSITALSQLRRKKS
jgi:hypothetical protein